MRKVTRSFIPIDRYHFDNKLKVSDGWVQVDTSNDAHYFGVWANPFLKKVISYIEGDIVEVEGGTDEEFINEINEMNSFYDGGIKLDCGWGDVDTLKIQDKLKSINLQDFIH